jgi:hypothetical protein
MRKVLNQFDFLTRKPIEEEDRSTFNAMLGVIIILVIIIYSLAFLGSSWSEKVTASSVVPFPEEGVLLRIKCPNVRSNTTCRIVGRSDESVWEKDEIVEARLFPNSFISLNITSSFDTGWYEFVYSPLIEISKDNWLGFSLFLSYDFYINMPIGITQDHNEITGEINYYYVYRTPNYYGKKCSNKITCDLPPHLCSDVFDFYPEHTITIISTTRRYSFSSLLLSIGGIISIIYTIGLMISKIPVLMRKIRCKDEKSGGGNDVEMGKV